MASKTNVREFQRRRIQQAEVERSRSPELRDAHLHAEQKLKERLEVFFAQFFVFLRSSSFEPTARRRWAAFAPLGHEPQLRSALQMITKCFQVEWVFPRVLNPKSELPEMEFYRPELGTSVAAKNSPAESAADPAFQYNSWGLSEPVLETSELVDGNTIDGFLIPALAFDKKGARLGRGKGYFDNYLSRFAETDTDADRDVRQAVALPSGLHLKTKIGIAFDDQILSEDLVTEAHDITMDIVLSESRLLISQAWWKHHSENARGTRIAFRQAFPGAQLFEAVPLKTIERA